MQQVLRLFALGVILAGASVAWLVLSGIMRERTLAQESALSGAVADLWGSPLEQVAPALTFEHEVFTNETEAVNDAHGRPVLDPNGVPMSRTVRRSHTEREPVPLASTEAAVDLKLDQRRKGLLWFALYDVTFQSDYGYVHESTEPGQLVLQFRFPQSDGFYDDFRLAIDGQERWDVAPSAGQVSVRVPVQPGQKVRFTIGYRSRGRDSFQYRPVPDDAAGQVRAMKLTMTTDFERIDFPSRTMSPSTKARAGRGWSLQWDFKRLVTGQGMGMVMPQQIQAGPLVAAMSLSAPLSLALYMVWIYVLGLLKRIEVHPVNHLFLAAAFFSFHLLFGYTADHLPVELAFGLSAAVSLFLTTTYLRLVVGPRFAAVEAGLAQLLYLVGFSLAHFFDGWTGLTVTVLGIATLFLLMQLTGRIRWSEVFSSGRPAPG